MDQTDQISLSDQQIASYLFPFGVQPSNLQVSQIRDYVRLLLQWNDSISLTSIEEPAEILVRHFGESMFACSLMPQGVRIADIGTGGGFPGLAMKILCPENHMVLIESNKKKCAFLSEVARTINLTGVQVLPSRFEEIRPEPGFVDVIVARALGGIPDLLRWANGVLRQSGQVTLWVGGEDATKTASVPGWHWQPAIKIPESQRRYILMGKPATQVVPAT